MLNIQTIDHNGNIGLLSRLVHCDVCLYSPAVRMITKISDDINTGPGNKQGWFISLLNHKDYAQ